MNMRSVIGVPLMLGFLIFPMARGAEPAKNVQVEVRFLLGYVEQSGCRFYRNGTWYDSKTAQGHLRDKYKILVANNQIDTTEDFIEKAASVSSFSGKPYQVICNGGAVMTSNQWLRDELTQFRISK